MTSVRELFHNFDDFYEGKVKFENDFKIDIEGKGITHLNSCDGFTISLTNVFYKPCLRANILSLSTLDEQECKFLLHIGL